MSSGWRTSAACAGLGTDLLVFDPDEAPDQAAWVRTLCDSCQVRGECLADELARMARDHVATYGIIAGTTPDQRKEMLGDDLPDRIKHGTSNGYRLCHARDEGACTPCKVALAQYQWELRQRRGRTDKERARAKRWTLAFIRDRRAEALAESYRLRNEITTEAA